MIDHTRPNVTAGVGIARATLRLSIPAAALGSVARPARQSVAIPSALASERVDSRV